MKKWLSLVLVGLMLCAVPAAAMGAGCAHHVHDGACLDGSANYICVCDSCVQEVQALIDALPAFAEIDTEAEKQAVKQQMENIDAKKAPLTDASRAKIDFAKYSDAAFALYDIPDTHFKFALNKRYEVANANYAALPDPVFSFVNQQGAAVQMTALNGAPMSAAIEVDASGEPVYGCLPAGTYTIQEMVDGSWVASLAVDGVKQDGLSFTGMGGESYVLMMENVTEYGYIGGKKVEQLFWLNTGYAVEYNGEEDQESLYLKEKNSRDETGTSVVNSNKLLDVRFDSALYVREIPVYLDGGEWKLSSENNYGIYAAQDFVLNVTGGSLTATGSKGAVGLENGCKITVNLPNDYVLLLDDEFKLGTFDLDTADTSGKENLIIRPRQMYKVDDLVEATQGGTVTIRDGDAAGFIREFEIFVCVAEPDEGYRFRGWMYEGNFFSDNPFYPMSAVGKKLTAVFEYVGLSAAGNVPPTSIPPKTGDESHLLLWMTALVLSGCTVLALRRKKA